MISVEEHRAFAFYLRAVKQALVESAMRYKTKSARRNSHEELALKFLERVRGHLDDLFVNDFHVRFPDKTPYDEKPKPVDEVDLNGE